MRSYSQPISAALLSGPGWLSFDSVTDPGEGKGGCVSCHLGFHFFSLHHIYGSPDASIHSKWPVFIWSTQVMEAIRQSPLSFKYFWSPPGLYHTDADRGTVPVKANIPACNHEKCKRVSRVRGMSDAYISWKMQNIFLYSYLIIIWYLCSYASWHVAHTYITASLPSVCWYKIKR